jgi:hypothetical protein
LIPVLGSILTQSPLPPAQPRSRSYHSTRSGSALDDSQDEYCIIKYVSNLEKNIKEKNKEIEKKSTWGDELRLKVLFHGNF